jgi:lipopolysaccharide export system permease protein
MMMLLPMAALAFAIPPKRSTSALGVFLSIVFIVTYHKINQYGESIGSLGKIDPIIALWGPFLLASGLIFWMYHVIAHRPGGQPIAALEYAFAKLGKQIGRLLRFVTRRGEPAQGAA